MNKKTNRLASLAMATGIILGCSAAYAEDTGMYEIYPSPQTIKYSQKSFTVGNKVNVVFESGIDVYTKNRLKKILKSHGITFSSSTKTVSGQTNILIGINKSGELVDTYFNKNVSHQESFFKKNDSHIVSVTNKVIGVLGDDTDSAFYGITTLKHVFNQIEGNKIREFRVDDYSDVKHRGFIEGYYGNPWSNEDRAELMKFGGDYKLNTYFFAPKDDPYHNQKWRELYPPKELAEIKKLAKVGNETKNKYVYALHTFMHSPIRFDNEANYQNDLNIVKAKFSQLLKNDVRAFSILADDASVPKQGVGTYVKLLKEMTKWLIEQKKIYPDLVIDIPFCPNDYGGNGSSAQLKEVNKAPDSTSIIMTGGRVWGEVSEDFTSKFIKNVASQGYKGRPSYLWINWPCSDNSKKHLIMGGNDTFLHPGVTPANIQGIMLNPMQQAEANKSALFAIAEYSWKIWDKKEQADQNWHDSFKYMDHGTAEENKASTALRTIAKHMINQDMPNKVRKLEESVEIAPKLKAFNKKLNDGNLKVGDTVELIKEFRNLQEAAAYYKENAGNKRTRDQIIYWLNCWEDTTTAAISYMKCLDALAAKDDDGVYKHFLTGQVAFAKSKSYKLWYRNHWEYAEVGVQHIVPFIKTMEQHLNKELSQIITGMSATKLTLSASFSDSIAIRTGGNATAIVDGNVKTALSFAKNPYSGKKRDTIPLNAFVQVELSTPKPIGQITFVQGKADRITQAALESSVNGKTWKTLKTFSNCNSEIVFDASAQEEKVKFVRIRNLEKTKRWWQVKEFQVSVLNSAVFTNTRKKLVAEIKKDKAKLQPTKNITLKLNQYVGLKLDRIRDLKAINKDITSDKLTLQVSANAIEWQTVTGSKLTDARYIRVINRTNRDITFDINKFEVESNEVSPITLIRKHAKKYNGSKLETAFDGDFDTTESFARGFKKGNSIVYDLGQFVEVDNLKYVVLDTEIDHVRDAKFQLSLDGKSWKDIFETSRKTDDDNAKPQDNGYIHGSLSNGEVPISHSYLEGSKLKTKARYFRILATKSYTTRWVRISEIVINNGEYIKPVNDPTFISTPHEIKGHGPEKMFDGDLITSYRPDTDNGKVKSGSLIYRLSDKTNVSKIRIIQDGNTISNAKVMVRTGKDKWTQIGSLNKSLNELAVTNINNIFEIKIEWKGVAPTIYEIVPFSK